MNKTAFIFPGQGAQYPGMGKDFYEQEQASRAVYECASDICGFDLRRLCFEVNQQLDQTEYTQIAMLTTALAMTAVIMEKGIRPDVTAGLSLGEYNALAVAAVMKPEDLFRIVRRRGQLMQDAVPRGGAMAAVLGASTELIEQVCEETEGIVTIANYNCPGQIVITGESKAVENAGAALKEQGVRRVVPLKVSGPFHSPLLREAGAQLGQELAGVTLKEPEIPYVTNVTAEYISEFSPIRALLARQVWSPVKWQQSVEAMIRDGVDTFVEIGPGRTLSGFMRKINRDVRVINIEKAEDVGRAYDLLYGGN